MQYIVFMVVGAVHEVDSVLSDSRSGLTVDR